MRSRISHMRLRTTPRSNAVEINVNSAPHTREVLLDGLRQALQARVGSIWSNVTLAGETAHAEARFIKGVEEAIKFYEKAWHGIDSRLPNDQ